MAQREGYDVFSFNFTEFQVETTGNMSLQLKE